MTHEELQDLIPAYALDALSPEEEVEVRAHLASCDDCQGLLGPLLETAGALALAAPPVTPPPTVRERILAGAEPAPHFTPAPSRRSMWWRVAAGLAAAAVGVIAVGNVLLIDRLNDRERRLEEQQQLIDTLASGSLDPTPMVAAGPGAGASGQIFVARDARSAAIVMTDLPRPRKGVYQLWLLENGNPVPLESFRPDERGAALVYVKADLDPLGGMAVTLEDRPSLPAPKGPAVLRTA